MHIFPSEHLRCLSRDQCWRATSLATLGLLTFQVDELRELRDHIGTLVLLAPVLSGVLLFNSWRRLASSLGGLAFVLHTHSLDPLRSRLPFPSHVGLLSVAAI